MAFGAVSGLSGFASSTDGLLDSASPDGGLLASDSPAGVLLASDSPVGGLLVSASLVGWAVGLTVDEDVASLTFSDADSAVATGLVALSVPFSADWFWNNRNQFTETLLV